LGVVSLLGAICLHVAEALTLVALHLRISWKRFIFADETFAAILSN